MMKPTRIWLLAALAVALVAAAALTMNPLTAQVRSEVGYVDRDLIVEAYAGREIASVLQERDRLQEEFDKEAADLDMAARQRLFAEYEERLAAYEQELGVERRMREIENALAEVVAESGVTVIVDRSAVVWGGVDLTQAVLRRLGVID